MRASWNKGSAYAWNDAKVRWLLALTMYTKRFSRRREWGTKSPLWSFIIDWAFCQGTENENEHWLTGAVARKRERERERLRWTPSYANSNQLNGVGGDETSLIWGRRERERESTTHDFPCFPWLVRILPAGLCKGDREIRLANLWGGGGGARGGWQGPHHIFRPNWEKWQA